MEADKNIAIITAVTGDYDHIGSHFYGENNNIDYIYFTDGKSRPRDKVWQVRNLPDLPLDPRRLAKFPKLHPHYFPELRDYDYVIWIDGSMQIRSFVFVDEILSFLKNGLVLSPHFDGRDCGYGEATIRPLKYRKQPLDEQTDFYYYRNFPEHFGLYEAGVQARDMKVSAVCDLGEVWLGQNLMWSYQDQVSLGYSLWKTGFVPDVLPKSFRKYNWVHINAHKSEK
jgi:hypothetical protein